MAITVFDVSTPNHPNGRLSTSLPIIVRLLSNQFSQANFAYVITILVGTNPQITYKVYPDSNGFGIINLSRFVRNLLRYKESVGDSLITHNSLSVTIKAQEFYGNNPQLQGTPQTKTISLHKSHLSRDWGDVLSDGQKPFFYRKRKFYRGFTNYFGASNLQNVRYQVFLNPSNSLFLVNHSDANHFFSLSNTAPLLNANYAEFEIIGGGGDNTIKIDAHKFTCEDKPVNCVFINEFGVYENFCFSHNYVYTIEDLKTSEYKRDWQYDNNNLLHINKRSEYVVKSPVKRKFQCVSHYVDADEANYYNEQILRSPLVWLEFEFGKFMPVTVENTQIKQFQSEYQDLINLQIGFRQAYDFEN